MKTVTLTKDAYIDNSVRVNYFDPTATRKETRRKPLNDLTFSGSNESLNIEDIFEEVDVMYENLVFCERLFWTESEAELDVQIENKRLELENKLNNT